MHVRLRIQSHAIILHFIPHKCQHPISSENNFFDIFFISLCNETVSHSSVIARSKATTQSRNIFPTRLQQSGLLRQYLPRNDGTQRQTLNQSCKSMRLEYRFCLISCKKIHKSAHNYKLCALNLACKFNRLDCLFCS